MSRIDDALRRLTGADSEPRASAGLERFASEGKAAVRAEDIKDIKKVVRVDEQKVAPFVAAGAHPVQPGPHPVETRAPQMKPVVPAPPVVASVPAVDVRPGDAAEEEKLVDFRQLADYAGYLLRSLGRHKVLAASTFLAV